MYTDENGLELEKRVLGKRNYPTTVEMEKIEGNFYPATTMVMIENIQKE